MLLKTGQTRETDIKQADKIEDVQNGRSNGQTLEDRQTHRESKLELILNFKIR